jgi:hypothetical protein
MDAMPTPERIQVEFPPDAFEQRFTFSPAPKANPSGTWSEAPPLSVPRRPCVAGCRRRVHGGHAARRPARQRTCARRARARPRVGEGRCRAVACCKCRSRRSRDGTATAIGSPRPHRSVLSRGLTYGLRTVLTGNGLALALGLLSPRSVVKLRCLGNIDGPGFLDGHTADGTVGLAPNTRPHYSGTRWAVF